MPGQRDVESGQRFGSQTGEGSVKAQDGERSGVLRRNTCRLDDESVRAMVTLRYQQRQWYRCVQRPIDPCEDRCHHQRLASDRQQYGDLVRYHRTWFRRQHGEELVAAGLDIVRSQLGVGDRHRNSFHAFAGGRHPGHVGDELERKHLPGAERLGDAVEQELIVDLTLVGCGGPAQRP